MIVDCPQCRRQIDLSKNHLRFEISPYMTDTYSVYRGRCNRCRIVLELTAHHPDNVGGIGGDDEY